MTEDPTKEPALRDKFSHGKLILLPVASRLAQDLFFGQQLGKSVRSSMEADESRALSNRRLPTFPHPAGLGLGLRGFDDSFVFRD